MLFQRFATGPHSSFLGCRFQKSAAATGHLSRADDAERLDHVCILKCCCGSPTNACRFRIECPRGDRLFLLSTAATVPSKVAAFGDWTVGCDNGKRCQMISLTGEDNGIGGEDGSQAVLTREAGPAGNITFVVPIGAKLNGPGAITIDGRVIATVPLADGPTVFRLSGETAQRVARAMAAGKALYFGGVRGSVRYGLSVRGVAAALRYIDAAQGRVNGVTALVANGSAPAANVPPAPALPHVTALKPPVPHAVALSSTVIAAIDESDSGCDEDLPPGLNEIAAYQLDPQTKLALLPCGTGAYNFAFSALLVRGGKVVPADFDLSGDLINAAFYPATGHLTSYDKSRGPGDCGSSQDYVWDGRRFRLIEQTEMDECRGSSDWITTWRAVAVFR